MTEAQKDKDLEALRPAIKDHHHQDSLFGNSFQSKSFFVVHPEWLSEAVDNTDPEPLHRPPWPWEQPRYRQNVQIPITYTPDEPETEEKPEEEEECKTTPPPLPYALPQSYRFTHPGIDITRPFDKHTSFGAPAVDTSQALRPAIKDHHHQDSLFGNSFQSKSFFVVHPEWLSEAVDNTDPEPLHRPPWPWEQPRYRQNVQIPITYTPDEPETEEKPEEEEECKTTPPPLPYALPQSYRFTHPGIDITRPFDKHTSFGAPAVDTSQALRPAIKDHHHQDSLFGNSFQSKSFFVVHPEWLSEAVDNTDPEPLHRPPWPWEQPRYRQNVQIPITYTPDEPETEEKPEEEEECKTTPPPLPYALPQSYRFTHPGIDITMPFDKHTSFGAPAVDTSQYKLSF